MGSELEMAPSTIWGYFIRNHAANIPPFVHSHSAVMQCRVVCKKHTRTIRAAKSNDRYSRVIQQLHRRKAATHQKMEAEHVVYFDVRDDISEVSERLFRGQKFEFFHAWLLLQIKGAGTIWQRRAVISAP